MEPLPSKNIRRRETRTVEVFDFAGPGMKAQPFQGTWLQCNIDHPPLQHKETLFLLLFHQKIPPHHCLHPVVAHIISELGSEDRGGNIHVLAGRRIGLP